MNQYQEYIHLSRYARWSDEKSRRETWEETVQRYVDFFAAKFPSYPKEKVLNAILELKVMPSMRALMTAGPALERDNIAGYNCSYLPIDHPRAFDEALYILMCGTGLGFSIERQYVNQLPVVAEDFHQSDSVIQVKDSRVGWAAGLRELISLLYSGQIPKWDLSKLRPAGAKLKTFGGRSSGPAPLDDLFRFTVDTFKKAAGRKLNSIEAHDLVCKIADVVVVGGVRRSALISLSNLSDERMRTAKNGQWWIDNPQRALANNSAAYSEKPEIGIFMKEWLSLYESKSGERGVFNRVAATKKAAESGRRDVVGYEYGTNPCGEIVLRPNGLCNLSEVVVRATDDLNELKLKVEVATIVGTYQSMLTDFRYVRNIWKKNCEDERLLGVSLTGIMDHEVLSGKMGIEQAAEWLSAMRETAIETNKVLAGSLGINQAVAITTVKPSGTVSQLVDSASGIHPRYAPYYIRTVRSDMKDPLAKMLQAQNVPNEPDVTKSDSVVVFSFPMKAPEQAVFRNDMSAIHQLEHYLVVRKHWCEHNPSITVYVRENEWMEVGAWVYKHFDELGGVSFLPHSDHVYKQAPYQELLPTTVDGIVVSPEEQYNTLMSKMPKIDWTKLADFEKEDQTTGTQELACVSGSCEI